MFKPEIAAIVKTPKRNPATRSTLHVQAQHRPNDDLTIMFVFLIVYTKPVATLVLSSSSGSPSTVGKEPESTTAPAQPKSTPSRRRPSSSRHPPARHPP